MRRLDIDPDAFNPLHQEVLPTTAWTTVNAAENFPGVMTPLGASFWLDTVDAGIRLCFHHLGVLPRSELALGATPDDRVTATFFGRIACNVDRFRMYADLTPGADGASFEEQIFSTVRPDAVTYQARQRYPLIMAKAPVAIGRVPGAVHRQTASTRAWWRAFTSPQGQARPAVEQLPEALRAAQHAIYLQMTASFVATELLKRLGDAADGVGRPELLLRLSTGYGGMEEIEMVSALYRIAHHGGSLPEFLATYGARCSGENELSVRSWRENPEAVEMLVGKYRDASSKVDPATQVAERRAGRIEAEQELLAALPAPRRPLVRLMIRLARTYVPLREEGKHILAMSMDAGRSAARCRGRELVAQGVLDDPEDVFQLTLAELVGPTPVEATALVKERKELRAAYETVNIPQFWVGRPDPVYPEVRSETRVSTVSGVGAAAGTATGRARVLLDAEAVDDLDTDEVLVCRTTDPSWAAAFHLASATVIDIGGSASHGAIISREMGLPCVINTLNGTTLLRTGDLVEVNGSTGVVTVLEPAVG